jgi:putative chitinase
MSTELAVLRIAPNASRFALPIENACIKYGIIEPIQKAHFLAQLAHESTGFKRIEENLNYSAERLKVVFPRYFRTVSASAYAHNPEKLGSYIYANRLGNGNEKSGDGYRFRGRGPIQCTGRNNYTTFSLNYFGDVRLAHDPDLMLDPVVGSMFAGWFWQKNGINALIDEDDIMTALVDNDDIVSVTRRVNGGVNGLDDRKHWLRLAKEAFQVAAYH